MRSIRPSRPTRRATRWLAAAVLGLCGAASADDVPAPPSTPLPTFENPLHDAVVGETLWYVVKDVKSNPPAFTRWFEERVVARTKTHACIETVETDETGTHFYGVDQPRSGWRPAGEKTIPKMPDDTRWIVEKEADEVIPIGTPPTKSVRARHRWLEEPDPDAPGSKRVREIWYSHDVPCTGKVRELPALNGGKRTALSWDRRMTDEECAKRAKKYGPAPEPEPESGDDAGMK